MGTEDSEGLLERIRKLIQTQRPRDGEEEKAITRTGPLHSRITPYSRKPKQKSDYSVHDSELPSTSVQLPNTSRTPILTTKADGDLPPYLMQCPEPYNLHYCYNDGDCVTYRSTNHINDMFCRCELGFHGERCEYSFNGELYGHDLFVANPESMDHEMEVEMDVEIGENRVNAPVSLISGAAASSLVMLSVLLVVLGILALLLLCFFCFRRRTENQHSEIFSSEGEETTTVSSLPSTVLSTIAYSNPPFLQPIDDCRIYRSTVDADTLTSDSDSTPGNSPIKPLVR
ncbi:unnamed protein product [Bursaphelenchus xylophilus]|uniref:(pine wood nematode) hypothetical protein n=1 Tax=Bursaphelenchus xylophilus TaxID=6326 RepID=A0A1I7SW43_BURXY|nr:unnamed protein product [Bursaphelenchus xylophilus]CAG9098784.1 unnamed protein product [Bursaphelenchus xylophilus]